MNFIPIVPQFVNISNRQAKRLKLILFLLFLSHFSVFAQNEVYQKLAAELKKYEIVYSSYSANNYPVLSGNAEIGALTDPLGRGAYNIEINDLYLNKKDRIVGPGMFLQIAAFAGLLPQTYRQNYNLENGILQTEVAYEQGSYKSEMYFSYADRELLVFSLTNTGNIPLVCDLDLGQFKLNLKKHTGTSIYAVSDKDAFTPLEYFLTTNIPFGGFFSETISPYLTVRPAQTLKITLRLRTNANKPMDKSAPADFDKLKADHCGAWLKNWQSMGTIILPEGDYARAFYRSLHWLQCTAGGNNNLPGETQFGVLSSRIAEAYQYRGKAHLNNSSWYQNPFTYGAAGWATFACILFGNEAKAQTMLANMYRPEALTKNDTIMFAVGKRNYNYGKPKGEYVYLERDNPDAFCFAHELFFDRTSKTTFPYDMQIHIQGFAPAMFYQFGKLYNSMSDTVYRALRGSAEFWATMLNYDAERKIYSLPPVLSLTEDLFEADLLDGLLAAKWTLAQAAEMAKTRNVDKDLREKWAKIAQNITFPDRDDVYLEFRNDDGSRRGAGYQGIRGYAYLGFPTLELMKDFPAKKVNKSLDQCWLRNKKGEGMITFIANWFALTDAYWGRAEDANEKMAYSLSQIDESGTAMCEQNGALYYFLTGYASFALVPLSMVLQTVGSEIRVFPAVPKAFQNIEFYNLPTIDGVRVSGIMKNGKTEKITFEKDGKIIKEITSVRKNNFVWKNNKLIEK
jgi:hypothetical protein